MGKEKVIRQKISNEVDLSYVPLVRVETVPAAAVSSYTLLSRHPMFLLINNPTDSADDLFPKFSINNLKFFSDGIISIIVQHFSKIKSLQSCD